MPRSCALIGLSSCGGPLSAEHYISRGILELVTGGKNTVFIEGLRAATSLREVGIAALTARTLCKKHNELLSPLDAEAKRLLSLIQKAQLEFEAGDRRRWCRDISGDLLERWILKVIFGMVVGRALPGSEQSPERLRRWASVLTGAEPFPEGWGLYMGLGQRIATVAHEFELLSRLGPDRSILAVDARLARVPFTLLLGVPDHPEAFGLKRPGAVIFKERGVEKQIALNWTTGGSDLAYYMHRTADTIVG